MADIYGYISYSPVLYKKIKDIFHFSDKVFERKLINNCSELLIKRSSDGVVTVGRKNNLSWLL